jgi:hypothetical protein
MKDFWSSRLHSGAFSGRQNDRQFHECSLLRPEDY